MMVGRGRRERGAMSGFAAFAAVRSELALDRQRPIFVLVSGSGSCQEACADGGDLYHELKSTIRPSVS